MDIVGQRRIIDCQKEKRYVASFCKSKIRGLELNQDGDLPLFYFPLFVKASKYKAERFCARQGLNFGINESSILEKITNGLTDIKVWATYEQIAKNKSDPQFKTPGIVCTIFHKQNNIVVIKNESCSNENNFVCTLPEICHLNKCSSKCLNGNCATVRAEDCDANCTKVDCSEEPAEKFGILQNDGDLVQMCGFEYFFSKISKYSLKASQTFCCLKNMEVASFTTVEELTCFANESARRNTTGASYWTSARLTTCPNTFVWCSESPEIVDQSYLPWKATSPFVGVKPMATPNVSLSWEFEDGLGTKRALCKASYQRYMRY
ncbi:uncharacterized protein LOC132203750 [Neocloeon triangulifer]|uniref:uncharacterized protein LOC132203750 n=1 Tax=Neocloeon triangulifer TaxID=2078957 RepID=UPI00286F79F9|nr:uncharacterized protein LOC132203750 [Neocloeon triangulifer]